MRTIDKLSNFWNAIQEELFPFLEEQLPHMLESHKKLVTTLELLKVEQFIPNQGRFRGRPLANRIPIARAFIAKSVLNLPTTLHLRERLLCDKTLRTICGWESVKSVPSESTFSRSFDEFSKTNFPEVVHDFLIRAMYENELVGHLSRDSTEISMREKSKIRTDQKGKHQNKTGGPKFKKGEGKCEKQRTQTYQQMMDDISMSCDFGSKVSSKGHRLNWIGYKLHVDVADGSIPISCKLTSASVNDAIMAIPLSIKSSEKVTSLYEVMDKGYYVEAVMKFIENNGRRALIHKCPKTTKAKESQEAEIKAQQVLNFRPAEVVRQKHRTEVERFFSNLKDNFGGRMVRVKGNAKVFCHLMFGVLALTASQLLRLIQ